MVGHDHPLLAEHCVQQARLADVRPAENGNPDRRVRDRRSAATRQLCDDRVEQVSGAVAVGRRERNGIAEAEPVELERQRILIGIVDLVGNEQHRLVGSAQDLRQLLVAGRDPGPRVSQEDDQVGLGHRCLCLLGDRARDRIRPGDVDAARVDQQEPLAVPFANELLAVSGNPGRRVHDGGARLGQAVHQSGFAYVREADDRDGAEQVLACVGLQRVVFGESVH